MTTLNEMHTAKSDTRKARAVLGENPVFGPQVKHLSQIQDQIMDEAQKFSTAWFKRRHEAAQSAFDVVAVMTTSGLIQPALAMEALADWQTHAMQRMAQETQDCINMMTHCTKSMISHEIGMAEEIADTAKQATSRRHATPV